LASLVTSGTHGGVLAPRIAMPRGTSPLVVLLAALLASGCGKAPPPGEPTRPSPPPAPAPPPPAPLVTAAGSAPAPSSEPRVITQEIHLGPGTETRDISLEVVSAVDQAFGAATHSQVSHAIDPTRIKAFESGGPSTWSVALALTDSEPRQYIYLTYGLSGIVDRAPKRQPVRYELTLAITAPADGPPLWPVAVLRAAAKAIIEGKDPAADPLPMDGISEMAPLSAVIALDDPLLPSIDTPGGKLAVRRLYALAPDEVPLARASPSAFAAAMRRLAPAAASDPSRASWAGSAALKAELGQ